VTWPATPQERHRVAAATFGARVRGVRDWDAPTPVAEWQARDVVRHLLEWLPGFLETGSGLRLGEVSVADADLATSWDTRATEVQEVLETHAAATYRSDLLGEMPLASAIDQFYVSDVVMHTWDLARAADQDDRLDPDFCAQAVAGMEPMAEVLAASGQFGPRVPVPDDADAQTRLIGLIGRRPDWRPGAWSPAR
jgi:uncharacterized protein (TIGR03086 family)